MRSAKFWHRLLTVLAILGLAFTIYHLRVIKTSIKAKVVGHETSSDRYGNIRYYTILDCNDGYLRTIEGLTYYVMPVGNETTYIDEHLELK